MSDFDAWQLMPAMAASLERLGWTAAMPGVREVMPPAVRGTNIVAVRPPAPAWGGPIAAGVMSRVATERGRLLVLTSPAMVAEWGALLAALAVDTPIRIEAARGPSRAARRLKADALDVLVASPETALTLLTRSSLAGDRFTAILFAWPEDWDADEAITVLLQDLPKDVQRVVLTARADIIDSLVDRYARRALRFGVSTPELNDGLGDVAGREPIASARTLATPWATRATALADLLEATDPATATIWTVDTRDHIVITTALGGRVDGLRVVAQAESTSGSVVCYDVPTLEQLRGLAASGDVTLLVPPGTETYVASVVATRRPVQGITSTTALLGRDAGFRAEIGAEIGRGDAAAALYALAPLFERHEPQSVAAALFAMWRAAQRSNTPAAGSAALATDTTPVGGVTTAKLWVGVGKKDEATVGDLVAVLVKEVGVDRTLIGRIELRDTFALVEVPAAEAERIAGRMTGLTIRRRKLAVRVDRGPGGPRDGFGGGASRGGGSGGYGAPRGDRERRR